MTKQTPTEPIRSITTEESSSPRSKGRLSLAVLALVVAALLAGCSSHSKAASSTTSGESGAASSGSASSATIVIKNFSFHPATLTVAPGTKVKVINEDSATHTVTATVDNQIFNTGDIAPGSSGSFVAPSTAGTYPYICLIHQFMHGTLVVKG